jgi:hypothetical protein
MGRRANLRHPQAVGRLDLWCAGHHLWSYAGDDFTGGAARPDVGSTFIQPFLSYTTSSVVTYGLTTFGPFPMSIGGGIGIFTAAPGGRPDWRVRFVATLLLPRR